jgi:very-short-patch-repair endonuclease
MLTGPGVTIGKARTLRKEMSLPEVLLWRELRKRPAGYKFRRQHPAGPFILDFACVQARLAIEVDGEAHGRGDAPIYDEARDEWLANQGYRTLRIPARDVLGNLEGVVRLVTLRCEAARALHHTPPASGPPPRSGEDLR